MLNTSVEHLEGTNVKLTVTVSADEVAAAVSAAYKELGAKVRVPGFRKGKAPHGVVDNYVGRDYVIAEATEELVNTTYPRAVETAGLRTVDAPDMGEIDTIVPGEDYTYSAQVELRPELTLSDVEGFSASVPSKTASDAEIDAQILMMQDRFATLEPVEDRTLTADDFALISFVGHVDGEPYEGNEVDKYLYDLGQGAMPQEFDAALVGAEAGAEIHVEFPIPDTSSNPEFVGKTAQFDVTVHEIKAKVLPALDDEFAGNVGFDSLEEMRSDMRSRLGVQKLVAHDRELERALKAQLAERLEGDVPEAMVRQRTSTMMRDFQAMLGQRDMSIEAYLQATGVSVETVESDISGQAAQAVKEDLALEALFRAKGMEVTDADIAEELDTVAEGTKTTPEEVRKRWDDMGLLPVVAEQIMHRKAGEWLIENATITETMDDAEAPSSSEEE